MLPGETRTVSILLDNETEYTAFQSDIYLPEGLTVDNFALIDRKNSNHTFTATELPDGGIRLLSYLLKLKTYSGALVTFDVTTSEEFAGEATIALRGTMFTTEAGVEVTFDAEECTVSLPATGLLGDVNCDGFVNITDAILFINSILNDDVSAINIGNADVNGDNDINITDIIALINIVLNSN